MANNSITSINSTAILVFTLKNDVSLPGNLPGGEYLGIPIQLDGWEADEMFSVSTQKRSESRLGLDGKLVIGKIPHSEKITFSLKPTSQSIPVIEALNQLEDVTKESLNIVLTVDVLAQQYRYVCKNGGMDEWGSIADHGKTQKARKLSIVAERAEWSFY